MALITDPDNLNQATEVVFDTTAKTIELVVAGNLSTDGVTLQALYSFCKEEWKNDSNLIKFDFPFTPITDESFELIDGWDFKNDSSRYLIRTGGWNVLNTAGNLTQTWAGIISLGSLVAGSQVYYDNGAGAIDIQLEDAVNQAIQVLSDPNGDGSYGDGFDRRSLCNLFVRKQGKTFGNATLNDIGVSSMENIVYRFPLANADDIKIDTDDVDIDANADGTPDISPYSGMSITYYASAQQRDIGGTDRDFSLIIDGNNGTLEQIYEFVQFELRQSSDIDAGAGTVTGKTADPLLQFVGDSLRTLRQIDGSGVYIDNFQAVDTNRLTLVDDSGTDRTFPFVAALTLQFNSNLVNDGNAIYKVFFTDANSNEFGTANAILVDDNSGTDMAGVISSASVALDFDFDGNVQGGRTAGTEAAVTVVAIGLSTGQYVQATGTITRSTSNVISLVAPLERNYANV